MMMCAMSMRSKRCNTITNGKQLFADALLSVSTGRATCPFDIDSQIVAYKISRYTVYNGKRAT